MPRPANEPRVALVSLQRDTQRAPPIGLVYLATYLRERAGLPGANLKIIESYFDQDMAATLRAFQPDLIGFTAMSVSYGDTIRFARRIRPEMPIPFLIGGVHISTLPESLDPVFDAGILGEGEATLAELLDAWRAHGGLPPEVLQQIQSVVYRPAPDAAPVTTPRRDPIKPLDDLPFPDFSLVHPGFFAPEEIPAAADIGVRAYVLSSRGCPYRCTFCSTARFWGKMRYHSPDYTARLTKHLVEQLGADYLWTLDDLFTVSPKRVREIREALERHGVYDRIKGTVCTVRANHMSDALCEELKRIKVTFVNFGFESGAERILQELKAGSVSVAQNRHAIELCARHGIRVYGSLMYGSPGETLADMRQTNAFIDFAIAHGARNIWSFVAAPYPGTPFWDIARQRGKVSNQMDWRRLDCHRPEDALLLDDHIDRAEFARVFHAGRRKLRRLKIRLIGDFLRRNPRLFLQLLAREPGHYLRSALTWITRQ
ncbi:MAG: B12-binding domain-containing radical SAM protein [Candidatus Marinimicrobia bacterium]|nr:B12-binding domain-containing radical SAM protein [Candidatus Neomarinimicrobiota bacterium]